MFIQPLKISVMIVYNKEFVFLYIIVEPTKRCLVTETEDIVNGMQSLEQECVPFSLCGRCS